MAFSFLSFLGRIPLVVVILAGLVASLVFWRKAGPSALWAAIGFGIMLLIQLFSWAQPWAIGWFQGSSGASITGIVLVLSLLNGLANAAGLACLAVALVVAWKARS